MKWCASHDSPPTVALLVSSSTNGTKATNALAPSESARSVPRMAEKRWAIATIA